MNQQFLRADYGTIKVNQLKCTNNKVVDIFTDGLNSDKISLYLCIIYWQFVLDT